MNEKAHAATIVLKAGIIEPLGVESPGILSVCWIHQATAPSIRKPKGFNADVSLVPYQPQIAEY